MKLIIRHDIVINVPRKIADCPYCRGNLAFTGEEWTHNDDGTISVSQIDLECVEERHLKPKHPMPYKEWAPIEERVIAWANDHYDFDLVDWDKKLKKWREAVEAG